MVKTRFAPSPTGFLHIGNFRTAVYAYALAKHNKGIFMLRIEDTDQKRAIPGSIDALKDTLIKFGLKWDEYEVQSDRVKKGVYAKAAKKLTEEGVAFYCDCPPKNAKEEFSTELRDPCRDKGLSSGAVKLKVPQNKVVSYFDFVHKKEISWNSDTVYDATLLKSDGFPTYHLAVAVDDVEMGVTHILRGHDWLPSTPIHLLVFEYLGGERPEIGHLSDILSGETGKKLSKRRDSVFVEDFLKEGYLPEALFNFVILLGWAPKDNRELFTLDEFVEVFDINGFQEANPKFFYKKLDWFNGHYIREKSNQDLASMIKPFAPEDVSLEMIGKTIPVVKDRISKLSEYRNLAGFFFEEPNINIQLFTENAKSHLSVAIDRITEEDFEAVHLNEVFKQSIEKNGFKTGDFFMDLRVAIAGSKFTPPITESMIILGRQESVGRIEKALRLLNNNG